jgi:2-polyprenyl-6-methoxyphenol hydroxylase-like FAD-dependent oxidoreductase
LRREAAFFWSLKPEHFPRWRDRGLDAWKTEVRAVWPQTQALLEKITDPDQLVLARYGHHTLPNNRLSDVPIAFVGDSAHSASPQLGQGANMALIDAFALNLALDHATDVPSALRLYARSRRRHVRVYQAMSRIFTPFFQSDSALLPVLRDRLVSPMTRVSVVRRALAALVAGTFVEPISDRGRRSASTIRRLL